MAPWEWAKSRRGVLVAEDDEINFKLAEHILRAAGHDVTWARDGFDALVQLRRGTFDLLLLDLGLPQVSGAEVLKEVRRSPSLAGLPVVIVTADATTGTTAAMMALGATAYITKPIDLTSFRATVDSAIENGAHTSTGLSGRWDSPF